MRYYQQGDVLIKKIEKIPNNAKRQRTLILAEGEATGHKHELIGSAELFIAQDNVRYLHVVNESVLQHEEHNPVNILPGDYAISIVREYDHFDEEARAVVD